MTELEEFQQEFMQEVLREADAGGRFVEDAFFDRFASHLVDAGELETADRAYYASTRGMRVDGYGGDPAQADGTLTLLILDFSQDREINTLTSGEMESAFRRAMSFLAKSRERAFRDTLEETSPGFGLADLIAGSWEGVAKIKLVLMSNRRLSSRVDGRKEGEYQGRPVVHSVWDLGRLQKYVSSGRAREDLLVELDEHGGPLPALPAHLDGAGYQAYLLVIPGTQLASIYDQWGSRLLEQNVRVFLQAKGGVNKGIRNTIENDPQMFFAYNNGITATAEAVTTEHGKHGLIVTQLRNLQIVNGGQTTASIHAASRKKLAELAKVFVQMKLSIIPPETAERVVPKISEYANSQNKVNAADFFANHPYHIRMKEISARVFAPSRDGTFRESKWFYERARGQYQDERGRLTPAQQRAFDLEYPKTQVFTKTDLAKYELVWEELPHIVSKGAQKNFAYFAELTGRRWLDNADQYNELYFREAVAKAIVFRKTEELVSTQPWYDGGYRPNFVAYAIAKLAHDTRVKAGGVDFEPIWKTQEVSAILAAALVVSATAVKDVILEPPPGNKNISEWAKQQACWSRVAELPVAWPSGLTAAVQRGEDRRSVKKEAAKEQKVVNGIQAQTLVFRAGGPAWKSLKQWATERRLLSQKEMEIMDVACAMPNKIPSDKQSLVLLATLKRLRDEGCQLMPEVQ